MTDVEKREMRAGSRSCNTAQGRKLGAGCTCKVACMEVKGC